MSGSEIDFISIFSHTMGTDEECDHCLSLFGRAQGTPVCIFPAFKFFLHYIYFM